METMEITGPTIRHTYDGLTAIIDGIKFHTLATTGRAYDACQTCEEISNGDLLLIPGERVIGIAWTWPIALTEEPGKLHQPKEGMERKVLGDIPNVTTATLAAARQLAALHDIQLAKPYLEY